MKLKMKKIKNNLLAQTFHLNVSIFLSSWFEIFEHNFVKKLILLT